MKKGLIAATALIILGGAFIAAMPTKARADEVAATPTWNGLYFGVNGGGVWGDATNPSVTDVGPDTFFAGANIPAVTAGGCEELQQFRWPCRRANRLSVLPAGIRRFRVDLWRRLDGTQGFRQHRSHGLSGNPSKHLHVEHCKPNRASSRRSWAASATTWARGIRTRLLVSRWPLSSTTPLSAITSIRRSPPCR